MYCYKLNLTNYGIYHNNINVMYWRSIGRLQAKPDDVSVPDLHAPITVEGQQEQKSYGMAHFN